MPSAIVTILYALFIIVYVIMGAAIIFHVLSYRIHHHTAMVIFFIYAVGGLLLLISNFMLFNSVNWYQITSNFRF